MLYAKKEKKMDKYKYILIMYNVHTVLVHTICLLFTVDQLIFSTRNS